MWEIRAIRFYNYFNSFLFYFILFYLKLNDTFQEEEGMKKSLRNYLLFQKCKLDPSLKSV